MSFGQTRQDLDVDSIRPLVQDLFASAAALSPRESAGIYSLGVVYDFGIEDSGFVWDFWFRLCLAKSKIVINFRI